MLTVYGSHDAVRAAVGAVRDTIAAIVQPRAVAEAVVAPHRSAASAHAAERASLFERAARAFESGRKADASALAQRGHELTDAIRADEARAAEAAFRALNPHLTGAVPAAAADDCVIDLHAQHVQEALLLLSRFVSLLCRTHRLPLTVVAITGAGRHSAGSFSSNHSLNFLFFDTCFRSASNSLCHCRRAGAGGKALCCSGAGPKYRHGLDAGGGAVILLLIAHQGGVSPLHRLSNYEIKSYFSSNTSDIAWQACLHSALLWLSNGEVRRV